jgi:hypothetical protein
VERGEKKRENDTHGCFCNIPNNKEKRAKHMHGTKEMHRVHTKTTNFFEE